MPPRSFFSSLKSVTSKLPSKLKISSGSFFHLHPQTVSQTRSDNHYISPYNISIVDGAASWKSLIDPYKYSSVFMREIQCYLKENPRKDLDSIIKEAFERTQEPGGVCCLLMSLNPDTMTLMSYILGDCGYAILRKDDKNGLLKVIHKSKEKSKFFNKSPQITKETDFFSYSQYSQHQMLENDFIISGSDGLFDNLYDWDILDCIKPFIQEYERILDLELVAEIIAKLALKKSKEINYKSPFSEQAKDYYFDYIGGKMDDITVIVSQISS